MARSVTVTLKDGTVRRFEHKPRAGGSWALKRRYENGWLIVVDEWEHETAFPASDVADVRVEADVRGF